MERDKIVHKEELKVSRFSMKYESALRVCPRCSEKLVVL